MGDKATLAKARRELEDLYLGIPDDSVNLTFQDLAEVKQTSNVSALEKKNSTLLLEPIQEVKTPKHSSLPLNKLPSLDFSKGLDSIVDSHKGHRGHAISPIHRYGEDEHRRHSISPKKRAEFRHAVESSMAYDDASVMSMASTYQGRGQCRRPGIPHSNICTICCTYIYIFRHRCLVCGRVYCRECVSAGMGEMTEGRKCVQCLGRRFSQRYIKRAGKVGCCSRYPNTVKQAELKWAEKGPRRSGDRAYGRSTNMMSRSRSPVTPRTPTTAHIGGFGTPSFVAASPYSPYTPNHHHLPL
ncbi:hypothetical protein Pint_30610 [Pistacia integerrima]|uniref:Uncharacterized protein n=1 Tax=Pistacia integerrima TaxID=434235 RepID=A0ACC0WXE5_9ROSI|nr:hypothetical protein Pint_30610 [Pistacia integerrima]